MSETLRKYNQKLLAIIGTLILVGISVIFLISSYFFLVEIFFDNDQHRADRGLLIAEESVEEAPEEPAVKQAISFNDPTLIDTAQTLYLIPVYQVRPEIQANNRRETIFGSSLMAFNKGGYSSFKYSGSYNNLLLYEQKENLSIPVFDFKIHIQSFQDYFIQGEAYLLIYGATKDSNKDKQLSNSDLQSFFLYRIKDKQLTEVTQAGMGLLGYHMLYGTDEIALRFGEDLNQDGSINRSKEPVYLKKLRVSSGEVQDMVSEEMLEQLQGLIE